MLLGRISIFLVIAMGLVSCQQGFPLDKNKIIETKHLKDREAKDPVLEKYIALINQQRDKLSHIQHADYVEIILSRLNFLVNQRDLEDYGHYTAEGLSDTYCLWPEGDTLICKPRYLIERVPKNHRIKFTPFYVKEYAHFLFRRK